MNLFHFTNIFIAFVFVIVISFSVVIGIFAVKAANQVNDSGIRGLLEQLWCGKDVDCKIPNISE